MSMQNGIGGLADHAMSADGTTLTGQWSPWHTEPSGMFSIIRSNCENPFGLV